MAAIELGIAVLMPNYIHRLAAALAAGVMLQLALTPLGGHALAAGLLTAAAVLAWLAARQSEPAQDVFVPMGYGAVLALIQTEAGLTGARWLFLGPHGEWLSPQAGQALVLAVFIAAIAAYLIHAGWRLEERRTVVALGVALLVGAASLKAPGIASGLLILLLGFAVGRRVMIGLGIAALLFCISSYYYLLDATLLYKAGVLAATGAGLLAARWVILRLVLPPEPGNA
jgi:uncharacterized membrane protein